MNKEQIFDTLQSLKSPREENASFCMKARDVGVLLWRH